ncbi:MAG: hypothetical protein QXU74_02265 [Candidatus Aenigmatarchaeota archaeon]
MDTIINKIVDDIASDESSKQKLKEINKWEERWLYLESCISRTYSVNWFDWFNIPIREMVFYEIQKRTRIDLGFCEYFKPNWRNIAKNVLEGTNLDSWSYCEYGGESHLTTCSGTSRDFCIFLRKNKRKI